ncbi:MAG: hypothetical protein V4683_08080 [Bacteroidota bacterium]
MTNKPNVTKILGMLLIILFSNNYLNAQENFSEKKAGNVIYLSMPNYLLKTNTLNDSAILQYMNASKEAYVIVIDDSKAELESLGSKYESISDFHYSTSKKLIEGLKNAKETNKKTFKIGTSNYSQSLLTGLFTSSSGTEIGISYLLTYIETSEHYYQILCWSTKEFYASLESDFAKISTSLKEGNCK